MSVLKVYTSAISDILVLLVILSINQSISIYPYYLKNMNSLTTNLNAKLLYYPPKLLYYPQLKSPLNLNAELLISN